MIKNKKKFQSLVKYLNTMKPLENISKEDLNSINLKIKEFEKIISNDKNFKQVTFLIQN